MAFNLYKDLIQEGLAANLPTAPDNTGMRQYYYAYDTGVIYLWSPHYQAWKETAGAPVVTDVTATYAIPVEKSQILLLDAVAGFVATLPTATGSGNSVKVVVKTTLTSGAYEVSVTSGDSLGGTIVASKSTTPTPYTATIGTSHNVSLTNATVGGGIKGDFLEFTDIAANVWEVQGNTWVSGTVATPFS